MEFIHILEQITTKLGGFMNPKPVIDAIKKIQWDKVMRNVMDGAKTLGAVGATVVVWMGIRDKTRKS